MGTVVDTKVVNAGDLLQVPDATSESFDSEASVRMAHVYRTSVLKNAQQQADHILCRRLSTAKITNTTSENLLRLLT